MCYYNRLTCSCVTAVSSKVFEEGLLSDFLFSRLWLAVAMVKACGGGEKETASDG